MLPALLGCAPPPEPAVVTVALAVPVTVRTPSDPSALPAPRVEPLPGIRPEHCANPDFPTLFGPWILWCSGGGSGGGGSEAGAVDRATRLDQPERPTVVLADAVASPVLAPGLVYAPGLDPRIWRLDAPAVDGTLAPERGGGRIGGAVGGRVATDGQTVVVVGEAGVEVGTLGGATRRRVEAPGGAVMAGEPPVVAGGRIAWIGPGFRVWVADAGDVRARPAPLQRPGEARQLVAGGDVVGWTERDADGGRVVVLRADGQALAWPAATGFLNPPSLWGEVACWEDRSGLAETGGDLGLRCSDGMAVARVGRATRPARHGPWLLFREGPSLMLATAQALALEETARYGWPVAGWRVERWDGTSWVAGEALPVGAVTIPVQGPTRIVGP